MAIRKRTWTNKDGQEGSAWVVDYADQNSKRRLKSFKTKKEADSWWKQQAGEVQRGTHTPDSESKTVAEAAELWLRRGELESLERGTLRYYRDMVQKHINPIVGDVKLSRLTTPTVQEMRDRLLATRSRAMTQKSLTILKGILKDAMRRGLVSQNVADPVKVRTQSRHKEPVVIPSKEEVRNIVGEVQGEHKDENGETRKWGRWRPLLITAIFTGLRASELRGLTWDNVDLAKGVIHVRQRADRYNAMGSPKSRAGRRDVPIGNLVANTLREWRLACPKGELNLVFPNGVGKVESLGNIYNRGFHPIQVACGIVDEKEKPKYGFHALRHFYASWLIDQSFKPKQIQTVMGHSSITLTYDTYGHLFPSEEDEQAKLSVAELSVVG